MLHKTLKLKNALFLKRKKMIRGKIYGISSKPRLTIFKSNRYFYAQVIDDYSGTTLCSINSKKLGLSKNKEDVSKMGSIFSETLKKIGISNIVFDRNGYLYHGVVAIFVDTLRDNGLIL